MNELSKFQLATLQENWRDFKKLKGELHSISSIVLSPARIEWLKSITSAIEAVYQELTDEEKTIINMRYWEYIVPHDWEDVAEETYVSRNKAIRMDKIIMCRTAQKLGWLAPD